MQNQLTSFFLKQKQAINLKESQASSVVKQNPENGSTSQSSEKDRRDACSQIFPGDESLTHGVVNVHITQVSEPVVLSEIRSGQKRKRNPVIVTPAWSYSEASSGRFLTS